VVGAAVRDPKRHFANADCRIANGCRETGTYGISVRKRIGLIRRLKLAALIILVHFSISLAMSFPYSVGVIGMGDPPKSGFAGLTLR
jgi:hypothetical protein